MADSDEDLQKEIERLRAENEALRSGTGRSLRLQVSAKGGVSLYGVRRFPVRVKCAMLPWRTLESALSDQHETASTE